MTLHYQLDNLVWQMKISISEAKLKAGCCNGRPFSSDWWSELEPHGQIQASVLAAVKEIKKFQVCEKKISQYGNLQEMVIITLVTLTQALRNTAQAPAIKISRMQTKTGR